MIEEFFLIYKDYACTKGSGDLPDFLIFCFMKLRNSCMFSKLSEMTIFRSCSMKFFGNFGGTERGTAPISLKFNVFESNFRQLSNQVS